ncbi:NAD(P)H-dependent oxidoreductase subunit E [Kouleothrix sp.]|uniref:NAD(P)H-dependent oxidoreductase subunit E n=1 Tax=Kouleothrix sp. TaxID=2779161 RepID=UPI00391AA034
MNADLRARLEQLGDDLRAGDVDRAALFWLKVFADAATGDGGQIRSDRWVDAGLAAARAVPGLDAAALAPRRALAERYGLFRFVRLKDGAEFSGAALADLDWQRKYDVGLAPAFAADLPALREWAGARWDELGGVAPTFALLEGVLARYAPQGRAGLLEVLHEAQAIFGGWLPRPAVERVASRLGLPVADVYGVTEFYEMFHTQPVGRTILRICQDAACALAGADALTEGVCRRLGVRPGETTADGAYTVEPVRCLGLCDRAPAALANLRRYAPLDPAAPERLLGDDPPPERQAFGGQIKVALANAGLAAPANLEAYRAQGGLAALEKALRTMAPAQVIDEVKESRLVGRGGAAFPAGQKWQLTASNPPGPRYVICNADESEPGAFKDRVLIENDPLRVLEGLLLACYAVGAERGFVYVRGEYRPGYERLAAAIEQLALAGYVGERILGSAFSCTIELRRGAGAYICGEETALMESIEGKRGFPRLKPPFPTTAGLWGRPTAINNVETLAKVPPIILYGGRWYANLGTPDSAGTKLFAVSGSVRRPGVYEVPFGVPLRHLIDDLAGGLRPGRALQAVLTGGAAGAFLTAEHLDTPLSFEGFRLVGGTIGAGTIMVFDDSVDMREVLARIGEFFAHESCGKCYPCQIGTQRQAEILRRAARRHGQPGDTIALAELGQVMSDASICGLGQAAALAIVSARRRWPDLLG